MHRYDATAISRLSADLDLPPGDTFTQDWVYEISEEYRTLGHLKRFANAYETGDYGANELRLLMHLMLDVTNDLLGSDEDSGRIAWQIVGGLLHGNYSMHLGEFEYWSLKNSSIEDAFAITPYIRQMANETGI